MTILNLKRILINDFYYTFFKDFRMYDNNLCCLFLDTAMLIDSYKIII